MEEWFDLHQTVTPETPVEDLVNKSRELFRIFLRAEEVAPGVILKRLGEMS